MQFVNDNKLNDRLVYALRERPSTITISTSHNNGRVTAGYIYEDRGQKRLKIFVSAESAEKALNSLSRKVYSRFHPSEKSSKED